MLFLEFKLILGGGGAGAALLLFVQVHHSLFCEDSTSMFAVLRVLCGAGLRAAGCDMIP